MTPRGAPRRKSRARKRGIALIMVLGSLAIITMMLAEFQADTSATVASAMAERDGVQAEYDARSAVNLSRLLIAMEPTIRQAIAPLFAFMKRAPPQLPVWEFSDRLLAPFNDKSSNLEFANSMKVDFGTGKISGYPPANSKSRSSTRTPRSTSTSARRTTLRTFVSRKS